MTKGFAVTGMSRDISWGMYIGHLTFFVGVAAGGVMIVLPYYLHDVHEYGRITVVGEFLAIPCYYYGAAVRSSGYRFSDETV